MAREDFFLVLFLFALFFTAGFMVNTCSRDKVLSSCIDKHGPKECGALVLEAR